MSISRLAACLLNISEAKNTTVIEAVAKAAVGIDEPDSNLPCKSTVLNIFRDFDYNRSVLTIAAQLPVLQHSVYNACIQAYNGIDLSQQSGGHPRLGAVDLVPIYPLSGDVSLEECAEIARAIASKLSTDLPGTSFFLFGTADQPKQRGLAQRRKEVGWFGGKQGIQYDQLKQDLGAKPGNRYGLTGVGASPYVTNCNVTIATQDIQFGRQIAQAIRASTPGGLPGIQAMAFQHEGNIEIACNVESTLNTEQNKQSMEQSRTLYDHYTYTPANVIEDRVKQLASERDVSLVGTALIGFTPDQALRLAVEALSSGQGEYWRTRGVTMM